MTCPRGTPQPPTHPAPIPVPVLCATKGHCHGKPSWVTEHFGREISQSSSLFQPEKPQMALFAVDMGSGHTKRKKGLPGASHPPAAASLPRSSWLQAGHCVCTTSPRPGGLMSCLLPAHLFPSPEQNQCHCATPPPAGNRAGEARARLQLPAAALNPGCSPLPAWAWCSQILALALNSLNKQAEFRECADFPDLKYLPFHRPIAERTIAA